LGTIRTALAIAGMALLSLVKHAIVEKMLAMLRILAAVIL
jgi:hypothetical protein